MAAAQMALAIEMNNRMKRKAKAMGVFLNEETQRKFLKMTSNVQLQEENKKLKLDIQVKENWYNIMIDNFEISSPSLEAGGPSQSRGHPGPFAGAGPIQLHPLDPGVERQESRPRAGPRKCLWRRF